MSEYTRNSENIYFLNDKNIISSIDDSSVQLNPIASQQVVQGLGSNIKTLSDDVGFLLSVGHDSMEYKGSLISTEYHEGYRFSLTCFLSKGADDPSIRFKNGFVYRIEEEQPYLSDNYGGHIGFNKNEYLVFNQDVMLSDVSISSFDVFNNVDGFLTLSSENPVKNSVITKEIQDLSSDFVDKMDKAKVSCYVVSSLNDISSRGSCGLSIDLSSLNQNSIAIVSSMLVDGVESRTAYIWNKGSGNWEAFNGNYDVENVYMTKNMRITYQLGKYTISSCGYTDIECKGKNMMQFFNDAYSKKQNPVVTYPEYTFEVAGSVNQKEVGETYKISSATLKYTSRGTYQYNVPKDNTGVKILKNTAIICCDTGIFKNENDMVDVNSKLTSLAGTEDIKFSDTTKTYYYNLSVHHTSGDIPVDSIGEICDLSVAISADIWGGTNKTVTKTINAQFKGYRKYFMFSLKNKLDPNDISKFTSELMRKSSDGDKKNFYSKTVLNSNGDVDYKLINSMYVDVGQSQIIIAVPVGIGYSMTKTPTARDKNAGQATVSLTKLTQTIYISGNKDGEDEMEYAVWYNGNNKTDAYVNNKDMTIEWS